MFNARLQIRPLSGLPALAVLVFSLIAGCSEDPPSHAGSGGTAASGGAGAQGGSAGAGAQGGSAGAGAQGGSAGAGAQGGGGSAGGGAGGVAGCAPVQATELEGDFLLSLATNLSAGTPVVFLARLNPEERQDGVYITLNAFPLQADDRTTMIAGPSIDSSTAKLDGGRLTLTLTGMVIPGAANPVTGDELEGDAVLSGELCSSRSSAEPNRTIDSFCGDASGSLTVPVTIPLDGSTFAAVRIDDPFSYPEAVLDCAGTLADPL